MKKLHAVLHRKEHELERLRREIHALRIVIPLLADEQSLADDVMQFFYVASYRTAEESSGNAMTDLETYYPFISHLRSEHQ